jgi:hypothetical protein
MRFKSSTPPGPAVKNEHHIFPRNAGGEEGPLVSLCVNHHSLLHAIAKRMQSHKPFTDLLAGEPPYTLRKTLWLAQKVVEAEATFEDDPDKHLGVGFKLSTEEVAILDALRKQFGNVSRKQIVLMGLKSLANQIKN